MTKVEENLAKFKWSGVSEENGLSYFYKWNIENEGWKEMSRDGASTTYEKDGKQVDVFAMRNEVMIIKK